MRMTIEIDPVIGQATAFEAVHTTTGASRQAAAAAEGPRDGGAFAGVPGEAVARPVPGSEELSGPAGGDATQAGAFAGVPGEVMGTSPPAPAMARSMADATSSPPTQITPLGGHRAARGSPNGGV